MLSALTYEEKERFEKDGYLMVKKAVTENQLTDLQHEIKDWVEESRNHTEPFGKPTIDGRPRFDMGTDHTALNPTLRRINNPSDISEHYFKVMSHSRIVDMVVDLVGENIKFHHCKINLKCPGANTTVHYHQDFAFTPHSNDDVVTTLLMLDDVTENNGCLMVVPGSHKEKIYSLYKEEIFVGKVDDAAEKSLQNRQVPVTGSSGDVCLMHTRLAHGSAPNHSKNSRGLYICVYSATDAVPLAKNPMPSLNEGLIVRGKQTLSARMINLEVELPKQPKSASFFTVQGQSSAATTTTK
jgi:ectoine hydroxylase-related dioxygenase (phytanoyl-CoA dioxygenase family)